MIRWVPCRCSLNSNHHVVEFFPRLVGGRKEPYAQEALSFFIRASFSKPTAPRRPADRPEGLKFRSEAKMLTNTRCMLMWQACHVMSHPPTQTTNIRYVFNAPTLPYAIQAPPFVPTTTCGSLPTNSHNNTPTSPYPYPPRYQQRNRGASLQSGWDLSVPPTIEPRRTIMPPCSATWVKVP